MLNFSRLGLLSCKLDRSTSNPRILPQSCALFLVEEFDILQVHLKISTKSDHIKRAFAEPRNTENVDLSEAILIDEPALEIDCIIIFRKLRTLPQDIILVLFA